MWILGGGMANKKENTPININPQAEIVESALFDEGIYKNIREILEAARNRAYAALSREMVMAYWSIGKQVFEITGGRAEYGELVIHKLSQRLTKDYGNGFSERNIKYMRQVYEAFPNSADACAELSWSHLRVLSQIERADIRELYVKECIEGRWSVRQLERQVHSFYVQRLLASQDKEAVRQDALETETGITPYDVIKDPYVLEFAGIKQDKKFRETDLEKALVSNLEDFMLELGKGFCLQGRQVRISYDAATHHYVDLVFYNHLLKCFVLIDLKTGKLTHADVGQMDFYVRYYDGEVKGKDDNPTIGIILCENKSDVIVKYSVLSDNKNLFASKYMLYLPTEAELKAELLKEKERLEAELKLK